MKIVADRNIPFVEACFGHLGQVELFNGRDITTDRIRQADALLVRSVTQVNEALLRDSHVQFVATATIGFEHVDRDYLADRGIGFSSAPGSNANSVAEYMVAALLEIGQRQGIQLAGSSIGIIGVGNVGSRVAAKCEGMGMRVVRNDPPLARATGEVKYRPIDEVFDCDFVTLHTPLTREGQDKTHHLADEAFFEALKPNAVFFNTGRGSVADTEALKNAMTSGRLGAVCLDVWENEPNIDPGLLQAVDLASPHIAGYSFDGKVAGMIMIYEALCKHFDLSIEHSAADFLPEPQVPVIKLRDQGTLQGSLHEVVQTIYAILEDDAATRKILTVPESQRGAFFDALRKNYRTRREFYNTTIHLNTSNPPLSSILAAIGFQMVQPDSKF
ncbi:MAG: 4-phosphoerythronate dehydrogenase [Phycisphaerae bacterium]|nr:4-phosphoerythronate dehydrogenase [Phycisphaerae bacterium]